jgi:hypothetical protein
MPRFVVGCVHRWSTLFQQLLLRARDANARAGITIIANGDDGRSLKH